MSLLKRHPENWQIGPSSSHASLHLTSWVEKEHSIIGGVKMAIVLSADISEVDQAPALPLLWLIKLHLLFLQGDKGKVQNIHSDDEVRD